MNLSTNISIGYLLSVVFAVAMPTVLSSCQPLPLQIDKGPNVPLKVSPHLSVASIVLFKALGLTSDSLKSSRTYPDKDLLRIKAAIKKGADVNAVSLSGFTPLWLAADADRADIVDCLLKHGARINGKSVGQETPLLRASEVDQVAMVRLLVKRGADLNIQNRNGFTPLIAALLTDKVEVVQILLAHHPNLNVRDFTRSHKTALGYALTWKPTHPEIIALIRKQGGKE